MRFGLLLILALGSSAIVRGQSVTSLSLAEQYLFSAANAERSQHGLPVLRWDDALYDAADAHAREMAARRSISHQYPGEPELSARARGAGARFSKVSENVAESPDAVTMQDAWMHSPGHRANLLDRDADRVGIRVIRRDGELYAVEDFDRSVATLTLEEQESVVSGSLREESTIEVMNPTGDSRRTCGMETGYAGEMRPGFVIRYTAANLSKIPEQLRDRIRSGRFRRAEVGACSVADEQNFATYSIAVMLFP